MSGRDEQGDGDRRVQPVDASLEDDIARVEASVTDYLREQTGEARQALLGALERLDEQADEGDAYRASVIGSGALGYAGKGGVVGETGIDSIVEEVPSDELNAQFALVRAAKDEVRQPTRATFAALQGAVATLAARRQNETEMRRRAAGMP